MGSEMCIRDRAEAEDETIRSISDDEEEFLPSDYSEIDCIESDEEEN